MVTYGRSGSNRADQPFGFGTEGSGAKDGFDVSQYLVLTHQEYGHCPHPKTLHERLTDSGTHGGLF